MEQLTKPESKKFVTFEINPTTTSEEILSLVDAYLSEIGETISPIDREFDSRKEFQTARKSPDRKQAINDFKKNLQNQIEGMASCRTLIESIIAQNPDVEYKILLEILHKFTKRYGITGKELEKYETIIKTLNNVRVKTNILREEFPNDLDLLNSMLEPEKRFDPSVDFKIIATPYGFIVHLKGSDAKRFYSNAENTGGFSNEMFFTLNTKDELGNNYVIQCPVAFVVTDSYLFNQNDITSEQVEIHELEHNKSRLIPFHENKKDFAFFINDLCRGRDGISSYLSSIKFHENKIQKFQEMIKQDPNKTEKCLKFISEHENKIMEIKVKISELENQLYLELNKYCLETNYDKYKFLSNEIISRKKDKGNHDIEKVIKGYSDFTYFNQILDMVTTTLDYNPDFKNRILELEDKYRQMYKNEALKASDSFDRLVNEGGYSVDEAISLLTLTPLQLWAKKTQRILESK